jgi:phosphatidylglycerophosphatase C
MNHDQTAHDVTITGPSDSALRTDADDEAKTSAHEVIAIFDFDKTIVSKDSGSAFIFDMIKRSRLRSVLAALATPVAAPLFLLPSTRLLGISAYLWIGTFGMSDTGFDEACSRFAQDFFGSRIGGVPYRKSLDALAMHMKEGHRIVVVSGSFAKLVQLMMSRLVGTEVEVVASTSRSLLGGRVGHRHCVGSRKLQMTIAAGIPDRQWDYGYTDSASDIPIMRRCRKRCVVNPDARILDRYHEEFQNDFDVLHCDER